MVTKLDVTQESHDLNILFKNLKSSHLVGEGHTVAGDVGGKDMLILQQ